MKCLDLMKAESTRPLVGEPLSEISRERWLELNFMGTFKFSCGIPRQR